jgi:hypothetical protein
MLELQLDKAVKKQIKNRQYYVFPLPATHSNYVSRPTKYPDLKTYPGKQLPVYKGKGSNGRALLHPDVMSHADLLMSALLEYGEHIDDWSMRSAVIQNGWRPDDASQGREYLRILKLIMSRDATFKDLVFPASLEEEAMSEIGGPGNPKLQIFMKHVAESPGWTKALADKLFKQLHLAYAPRGFNPQATGFVFDLDFTVYFPSGREGQLGADTSLNPFALQSAAGMWLNKYAPIFCFDSYDTSIEVWHQEYRFCGPPSIPASKIPFTA